MKTVPVALSGNSVRICITTTVAKLCMRGGLLKAAYGLPGSMACLGTQAVQRYVLLCANKGQALHC